VVVFLGVVPLDQIGAGGGTHVGLERAMGLFDQRDAVSEEEHALDAVGAHELVGEGDHGAGLAAAWVIPPKISGVQK